MSEYRHNHDLDNVFETDKYVVEKVAEYLARVVDAEIPGFQISHDMSIPIIDETKKDPSFSSQKQIAHWRHQALILAAANLTNPSLIVSRMFSESDSEKFSNVTAAHYDKDRDPFDPEDGFIMVLRLHTADEQNGAVGLMVNGAPGLTAKNGDQDLFVPGSWEPTKEALEFGYDGSPSLSTFDLLEYLHEDSFDPIVSEADVYHFTQYPLSSIIFRSKTNLGQAVPHVFASDYNEDRYPLRSDLDVFTS